MQDGIVSTIAQRCKRCYSCIRECPATAIRVVDGQAVVIEERCISCGHCVKVCSQHAKNISSDVEYVLYDLLPHHEVIAIIAPAFAASFPKSYNSIPTALRRIGFSHVNETAFGADLISENYKEYIEKNGNKVVISSACPAVYYYIEKYFVELTGNLAPIVSPMIAMGRYFKSNRPNAKIVFIGPCVAKKKEYTDPNVEGVIDAVLTFAELKSIFDLLSINPEELEESNFDAPRAFMGKTYPLAGGLLKTASIKSDVLAKDIIIVEGKEKVKEIVRDISNGEISSKFIDILFCEGCINGPFIDSPLNFFSRREKVIEYVNESTNNIDKAVWKGEIYNNRKIDLTREFTPQSKRRPMPSDEQIETILARTKKYTHADELNCGACGYPSCREYAIAIGKGLAEEDMCLPYLIEKLEKAYAELKETQMQLHNAEKLASIGQLAAGVAHELNNPLGTIMLYSSMLKRDLDNTSECAQKTEDLSLILSEAKRCKDIVSNLLNFARQGKLKLTEIGINDLFKEILKVYNFSLEEDYKINLRDLTNNCIIEADKDQLKQVFINIINNSIESMDESKDKLLVIEIRNDNKNIKIEFKDSGCGIPEENMSKLFTPFFTTKKIGKGTGLGLAITYGIIKMHKGDIKITSELNHGTIVKVNLPLRIQTMTMN